MQRQEKWAYSTKPPCFLWHIQVSACVFYLSNTCLPPYIPHPALNVCSTDGPLAARDGFFAPACEWMTLWLTGKFSMNEGEREREACVDFCWLGEEERWSWNRQNRFIAVAKQWSPFFLEKGMQAHLVLCQVLLPCKPTARTLLLRRPYHC